MQKGASISVLFVVPQLRNIGNLKNQMKYADKLGSPAVIFYGENEIKSGKATLKNLKSSQETSIETESLVDEIKKLL